MRLRFFALAAVIVAATALSACGFQLRQSPSFAFQSLYIAAPATSSLATQLQRSMQATGTVTAHRDAPRQTAGEAIIDLSSEQRDRVVVARNVSGQVTELQLRLRVHFKLRTPGGDELLPDTEVLQYRDVSYSESLALAKEAEEALLYRNMEADVVQQIMRRLAAVKL